ncbi:hypothetical protein QM012_001585 [Aureobasidium pullulans]|uniref:Uncharacterized protein n=1 Tax=Aureobasidium pullulans TaxID=5580 RepID=A0ABR0TEI0_AURPU
MSPVPSQYTWLWCDDHKKVTDWSIFIDKTPRIKKLPPHEQLIIDCLCKNPIPAAMLIEALKKYNKYIGGSKGDLKGKGLIRFGEDAPGMRAIKDGEKELYYQIARYHKKRGDTQFEDTKNEDMEDEEMADAEAPTAGNAKENVERSATFGIAIVGGKKNDVDQDMACGDPIYIPLCGLRFLIWDTFGACLRKT